MSYRRNGRGKWVHTLIRYRIYRLSEITIPQLTSLQSDAGAMRLARRLDCRYGVFQSVGKMHIRHPSCRYGVLCVRRGCPQVPVRVALGDGSPQAGGLPLRTPGLSERQRVSTALGSGSPPAGVGEGGGVDGGFYIFVPQRSSWTVRTSYPPTKGRNGSRQAPERRRRERIATGLLRTGTGLPRWCIRLARRRSCCARLRSRLRRSRTVLGESRSATRRSRGQPPRNGGAPLRLRTAPPRNGTAPLRLRTAPPQNGAAPLRLRTAPPQNRAARLQTRTVPLQSRTSSPQNRGRPEPLA